MTDLFTRGELGSYLQVVGVDDATADLLLSLITTEIRLHVGAATYDALSDTDLASFKSIALEAARRSYLNPSGLRQRSYTIDDYTTSETLAAETVGGVELTEAELDRIDRILGRSAGSFTVRPAGVPDCPVRPLRRRDLDPYCL